VSDAARRGRAVAVACQYESAGAYGQLRGTVVVVVVVEVELVDVEVVDVVDEVEVELDVVVDGGGGGGGGWHDAAASTITTGATARTCRRRIPRHRQIGCRELNDRRDQAAASWAERRNAR